MTRATKKYEVSTCLTSHFFMMCLFVCHLLCEFSLTSLWPCLTAPETSMCIHFEKYGSFFFSTPIWISYSVSEYIRLHLTINLWGEVTWLQDTTVLDIHLTSRYKLYERNVFHLKQHENVELERNVSPRPPSPATNRSFRLKVNWLLTAKWKKKKIIKSVCDLAPL